MTYYETFKQFLDNIKFYLHAQLKYWHLIPTHNETSNGYFGFTCMSGLMMIILTVETRSHAVWYNTISRDNDKINVLFHLFR
jgi:hypothetical protein